MNQAHFLEGIHILIVDDHKSITRLFFQVLTMSGARVTAKNNPISALWYFRNHHHEVDLVITDQTMPELTGLELAQSLRKLDPHVKIFLCTGHNESLYGKQARDAGIVEYLTKPIRIDDLLKKLKQHLVAPGMNT